MASTFQLWVLQVVEAAARRALAAERAQQQALQVSRQADPRPVPDDAVPSTSGQSPTSASSGCCRDCLHCL